MRCSWLPTKLPVKVAACAVPYKRACRRLARSISKCSHMRWPTYNHGERIFHHVITLAIQVAWRLHNKLTVNLAIRIVTVQLGFYNLKNTTELSAKLLQR